MDTIIQALLNSDEAAVRLNTLVKVLGADPSSPEVQQAQAALRQSPRVQTLLSERDEQGRIPGRAYFKWTGAHWVLLALTEIGYPPGDRSLMPLLEQEYAWFFSPAYLKKAYKPVNGRVRRCASQEAVALLSALALGLDDERSDQLAARLMDIQWEDGGWNCDKKPEASKSSFMETLLPLRALARYAQVRGDARARQSVCRAADVFLRRDLFKRQSDGTLIDPHFVQLHYPVYWHYDILAGLKGMAEAGFIGDPRCRAALDALESRRLPQGGFPADGTYYRLSKTAASGRENVRWGKRGMNEFVTVDALYVLKQAGRL